MISKTYGSYKHMFYIYKEHISIYVYTFPSAIRKIRLYKLNIIFKSENKVLKICPIENTKVCSRVSRWYL